MLKLHHAPNSGAAMIVWLLEELKLAYALNSMEFHPRALKSDAHQARSTRRSRSGSRAIVTRATAAPRK